jgi:hypothetical protein
MDAPKPPTEKQTMMIVMETQELLQVIQQKTLTTKSKMAREKADLIAFCACEGFISTMLPDGYFTNRWMITEDGIDWLKDASSAVKSAKSPHLRIVQ